VAAYYPDLFNPRFTNPVTKNPAAVAR